MKSGHQYFGKISQILYQAKLWNKEKINKALKKTYEAEINIKSTDLDKKVIIKKLLVDVCCLANAS